MVTGCLDRIREAGEDSVSGVVDDRRLAVHDLRGSNHLSAEDFSEALQSQAHTEDGPDTAELLDEGVAQPGIRWTARPRTDENTVGFKVASLLQGQGVVAMNDGFGTQLPQILDEVVDERVVVVDHQNSGAHRVQRYLGTAQG